MRHERSFENFAQERPQKDLTGYRKNGLIYFLHRIEADRPHLADIEWAKPGFMPDGTRLRRQPAFNPACEPWDTTLELWEIEDTHPLTKDKMRAVSSFANDLYDESFVFTELWVCDRYGLSRRKVYDVRDHIDGGTPMPDAQPHEWRVGDNWVSPR